MKIVYNSIYFVIQSLPNLVLVENISSHLGQNVGDFC